MNFGNRMKFGNPRQLFNEQIDLQITSMADIFTILLVFMLKSYSASVSNIQLVSSAALPSANHAALVQEAPRLEISKDGIHLDGKKITSLTDFAMAESDQSLLQGLPVRTEKTNSKILVLADKQAPYSIVKKTLQAAAAQGFTDYQLVVLGEAR